MVWLGGAHWDHRVQPLHFPTGQGLDFVQEGHGSLRQDTAPCPFGVSSRSSSGHGVMAGWCWVCDLARFGACRGEMPGEGRGQGLSPGVLRGGNSSPPLPSTRHLQPTRGTADTWSCLGQWKPGWHSLPPARARPWLYQDLPYLHLDAIKPRQFEYQPHPTASLTPSLQERHLGMLHSTTASSNHALPLPGLTRPHQGSDTFTGAQLPPRGVQRGAETSWGAELHALGKSGKQGASLAGERG